jgi:hypothetical protein
MDRAAYSNTGDKLDFLAPGTRIMSTVPKHWYSIMTGTSMACPWVAGIAALYLAHCRKRHPDRIPKCSEDYRKAFRAFTIPVRDELMRDKQFYQGFGILDPRKMHDELFD